MEEIVHDVDRVEQERLRVLAQRIAARRYGPEIVVVPEPLTDEDRALARLRFRIEGVPTPIYTFTVNFSR